jgi:hypothetical protein
MSVGSTFAKIVGWVCDYGGVEVWAMFLLFASVFWEGYRWV